MFTAQPRSLLGGWWDRRRESLRPFGGPLRSQVPETPILASADAAALLGWAVYGMSCETLQPLFSRGHPGWRERMWPIEDHVWRPAGCAWLAVQMDQATRKTAHCTLSSFFAGHFTPGILLQSPRIQEASASPVVGRSVCETCSSPRGGRLDHHRRWRLRLRGGCRLSGCWGGCFGAGARPIRPGRRGGVRELNELGIQFIHPCISRCAKWGGNGPASYAKFNGDDISCQ